MVDLSNQLAEAKMVVLDHFKSVDESNLQNLTSGLVKNTHPNCQFHFVHPFPSDASVEEASDNFWLPLRQSFSPLQRRQDIFFAGLNDLDDDATLWVVSMGHLESSRTPTSVIETPACVLVLVSGTLKTVSGVSCF